jgi:hypothetical protein
MKKNGIMNHLSNSVKSSHHEKNSFPVSTAYSFFPAGANSNN